MADTSQNESNLLTNIFTRLDEKFESNNKEQDTGQIRVFCRVRPLNRQELKAGNQTCLQYSLNRKLVMLSPDFRLPSEKKTSFKFSHVFD